MEALERKIEYYVSDRGEQPFRDWLLALQDKEGRRKIWVQIDRLSLGNLGKCKSVGDGVMEAKIDFGPGYRVYFGLVGKTLIILLCGGDKSTQRQNIRTARTYWADFRRRHEKDK